MGCCFNKLDSIEHVKSVDDILYIINIDKTMFITHLQIVIRDKVLSDELKQKKANYFQIIISKLDEYFIFLNKKHDITVSIKRLLFYIGP